MNLTFEWQDLDEDQLPHSVRVLDASGARIGSMKLRDGRWTWSATMGPDAFVDDLREVAEHAAQLEAKRFQMSPCFWTVSASRGDKLMYFTKMDQWKDWDSEHALHFTEFNTALGRAQHAALYEYGNEWDIRVQCHMPMTTVADYVKETLYKIQGAYRGYDQKLVGDDEV